MSLSASAKTDIELWIDTILISASPISHGEPNITLACDASTKGRGGHRTDAGSKTGERWSPEDSQLFFNINRLEVKAALLALQNLCSNLSNCHIRFIMDNGTAVAYVKEIHGWYSHSS